MSYGSPECAWPQFTPEPQPALGSDWSSRDLFPRLNGARLGNLHSNLPLPPPVADRKQKENCFPEFSLGMHRRGKNQGKSDSEHG